MSQFQAPLKNALRQVRALKVRLEAGEYIPGYTKKSLERMEEFVLDYAWYGKPDGSTDPYWTPGVMKALNEGFRTFLDPGWYPVVFRQYIAPYQEEIGVSYCAGKGTIARGFFGPPRAEAL